MWIYRKTKSHLLQHLNRKNICKATEEDISIELIKKHYNFVNIIQDTPKLHQISTKIHQNDEKNIHQNPPKSTKNGKKIHQNPPKSTKNYICEFCNNNFTRSDSLNRHYNRCKLKKESENIIIKENEMMKKELEELKKMTNINTQNNITNNNIINNININNYGDEDISYLKSKDFLHLFGGIYGAIPKLIEKIHFNPNYPENQNIKYSNKKLPYLKIRKDNKWQLVNKKHELLDLIDNKCFMLKEKYYKILEKKI